MSEAVDMSEVSPRPCAHDPRPWKGLAGVGMDLRTGRIKQLQFLKQCPLKAIETSDYCMPHTVFHGGLATSDWTAQETLYLETGISLFARGLLIMPAINNTMLCWPSWWPHRFN